MFDSRHQRIVERVGFIVKLLVLGGAFIGCLLLITKLAP
jgi:hypothetical protein